GSPPGAAPPPAAAHTPRTGAGGVPWAKPAAGGGPPPPAVPSGSRATHPSGSQANPDATARSFGNRASPSAASHSRTDRVSLPNFTAESRPSAPRTATTSPPADTITSGRAAIMATAQPANTSPPPTTRNGP